MKLYEKKIILNITNLQFLCNFVISIPSFYENFCKKCYLFADPEDRQRLPEVLHPNQETWLQAVSRANLMA